jgi:hypothetical protein
MIPRLAFFLLLPFPALAATETRLLHDASGRVLRALVLEDAVLQSETVNEYAGDQLVRRVTTEGAKLTTETWTWEGALPLTHEVRVTEASVKDALVKKESWTYAESRPVKLRVEEAGEPPRVTSWTWDARGNPVQILITREDGTLVSRTLSEFGRPVVPVRFAFEGGGSYASNVDVVSVTSAFSIGRSPDKSLWSVDPLEFKVGMSWTYAQSGETLVNNHLGGNFAMDYNHLFPRTTLFLFANLERNPVSHLNLDLLLAPLGIKYDLLDRGGFLLDASFAPVWNYRSISVEAGGTCDGSLVTAAGACDTNKVRGSFRTRAILDGKVVDISQSFSYLPDLGPAHLPEGLSEGAILQDTLALNVALSSRLTLKESLFATLDPSLKDQADCVSEPDNLLCSGVEYGTNTTLVFAFDLKR